MGFTRGFEGRRRPPRDERLPPGQYDVGSDWPVLTAEPGWYTRAQLVERYAERTGRDVTHIGYYEVLGVFKLAVILQQIYRRFNSGQTQDERFRSFGGRARRLAELAARLAEKI